MAPESESSGLTRRALIGTGVAAGAGLGMVGLPGVAAADDDDPIGRAPERRKGERFMGGVPFERHEVVRVGIIGLGMRGGGMLDRFLATAGVRVTALGDINQTKLDEGAAAVRAAGQPDPALYKGEHAYEKLARRDDVDFIYTATPWEYHHPICISAMENGKHVGTELPLAMNLDDLWDIVRTSERTRRHAFIFHNRSYGLDQLRMLRFVEAGRLGKLLYGSGGYVHDLRELNFSDDHEPAGWRRKWHTRLNANLYPVHGLAPISNAMKITRGDRYDWLIAVASPEAGYSEYRAANMPPDHPSWRERYVTGDTNMCFIQTVQGRFIRSEHDVSAPHPYTRANTLQGSKGKLTEDDRTTAFADRWQVYVEPDHENHRWRLFSDYGAEYDHWLWKAGISNNADQLVVYRTMQLLRLGLPPDIDVYDSATWTAPIPLSHESVKRGSRAVKVPDFTRGHWREDRPNINSEQPAEM
ncbi:Gfo/Idh/MocA family protein [Jiangella mangrovi]|uniref:Glycosyl hydrolase family 109 protein n=1 Tax=Jiangella mangrovi TaxID=1524084 RepID=A0A7W9LJ38_9ACTN|nr:Gfo/Idh/MocA family oxidoreductase [Jiangella mangrovi]MBB5785711.1 putative dehydrogenase [Jiangella mangrovi]